MHANRPRKLTARQQECFDLIEEHSRVLGFPPTIRDLGRRMGIESPNGVLCHLRALEEKGYIHRIRGRCRAITLVGNGRWTLRFRGVVR